MTNKLESNQLTYLLIRIILRLFKELHEITVFAVYFRNIQGLLFRAVVKKQPFTIHRNTREGGDRHLDVSQVITTESSPLHTGSCRTRTENLWFPSEF